MLHNIDRRRQFKASKRLSMGVIAEKLGQMRCDMTAQVMSTLSAWSHSHKLTSK